MLQFIGSQRVRQDLVTEQQQVCMEFYIQEDPMLVLMFYYQCLKILNIVLTEGFTFYFSVDLTDYVVGSDCMPCM